MLRDAARDGVGCVLLDVVLGHGVARRSGRRRSPTRSARSPRDRPVIAHVCGTPDDPQDARRQEATLRDAGVDRRAHERRAPRGSRPRRRPA